MQNLAAMAAMVSRKEDLDMGSSPTAVTVGLRL